MDLISDKDKARFKYTFKKIKKWVCCKLADWAVNELGYTQEEDGSYTPPLSGGGGAVDTVTGDNVDNTDPANPIINGDGNGIISELPSASVSVNGTGNDLEFDSVNTFRVVTDGGAEIELQASELEVNTDLDLNGVLNTRDGIIFQLIAAGSTGTNTLFRDGTNNRLYYKNNLSELLPLHQLEEEIQGSVFSDNSTTSPIDISWADYVTYNLVLTEDTTFTESDVPALGFTKVISIYMTGDFIPTFPGTWTVTGNSDAYDGTGNNRITVEVLDSADGLSKLTYYTIENI